MLEKKKTSPGDWLKVIIIRILNNKILLEIFLPRLYFLIGA